MGTKKHKKEKENINHDAQNPENKQVEAQGEDNLLQEIDRQKDSYLRLLAEFDNFKKRSAKERNEWIKFANEGILAALLPILDDFERGLADAEKTSDAHLLGFTLIYNKLKDTLRQKGLHEMETKKGDDFSTDFHEAIAQIPAEEGLQGKIMDVVQKGYMLGDKVLRYARVVVGQ